MRRRGIAEMGLRSGDRVALLLGKPYRFVLAMFGAAHLGLVTVMLSTVSKSRRLRMCVRLRCSS